MKKTTNIFEKQDKLNKQVDELVKTNPTKLCDTCKKERPSIQFVTISYEFNSDLKKKRLNSTCRSCQHYKTMTKTLALNAEHLQDCCAFIINYEKENDIKSKSAVVDLKTNLAKVCGLYFFGLED